MKAKVIAALLLVLTIILALALSWAVTVGIVWLICRLLGVTFSLCPGARPSGLGCFCWRALSDGSSTRTDAKTPEKGAPFCAAP